MLDMVNCAEQYKCTNVKTQMHNKHLMQEQNTCTYIVIAMFKSLKHNIIYVKMPILSNTDDTNEYI